MIVKINSITLFRLIISLSLLIGTMVNVQAVTDAELEALEKQLEQQEAEEQKRAQKQQAEEKRKKTAELRKKAEAEQRAREEQARQQQEEERLNKAARLAEQKKLRQKQELKKKYILIMTEADQALSNKNKNLAIKKYNDALALFPGDAPATIGLKNAKDLKHRLCYEVLGKWIWDRAFGQEFIILHENGSIDYQTSMKGSGNWECTDPENRTIKIRISMAGFSNEWLSTYSEDGSCLLGPETWGERGCYHRP